MNDERRIPRRRALVGAGAAAAIVIVTLHGINSPSNSRSTVAEQAPAGGGGDPGQWARHEHNLQRLRTALGASDWRVEDRTIEGRPRSAALTLDPNSRPAKAFNKDQMVTATIDVEPGGTVGPCPPPVNEQRPCVVRKHAGRDVRLTRALSSPGQSTAAGATLVESALADGRTVSIQVAVLAFAATHEEAHAWLPRFDDALLAAVTDPGFEVDAIRAVDPDGAPGYAFPVSNTPTKDVDLQVFRKGLGADWYITYDNSGGVGAHSVALLPHSPTHRALPKGWGVGATFSVADPRAGDDPCGPKTQEGVAFEPCRTHILPDGRTVQIRRSHSAGDLGYEGLRVIYLQPDGTRVVAEIMAVSKGTPHADPPGKARTWVDAFEKRLIAAATSKQIHRA